MSSLLLLLLLFFHAAHCNCQYSIASYDFVYINSTLFANLSSDDINPHHTIPVAVYYPIITNHKHNNDNNVNLKQKSLKFPLIIFGHCEDCDASNYNFVWQSLVPKGYIFAFPDSYTISAGDKSLQFSLDFHITLNYLIDQSTRNITCPIYGLINPNAIGVGGHSMGGAAAYYAISNYTKQYYNINNINFDFKYQFNSVFTVAGCGNIASQFTDVFKKYIDYNRYNLSFFLMDGTSDCICDIYEYTLPYYNLIDYNENLNGNVCKYLAIITNATHCNFENIKGVKEESCEQVEIVECNGVKKAKINAQMQHDIVVKYMDLWFGAVLKFNSTKLNQLNHSLNSDYDAGVMSIINHTCSLVN